MIMASKGAMTKFYTYARTMKSDTEYATKMKRLSNQIFGEVVCSCSSNMKVKTCVVVTTARDLVKSGIGY